MFIKADQSKIAEQKKEEEEYRAKVKEGGNFKKSTPWVFFSPVADSSYHIRILPPWTDTGENAFLPYRKIYQHWGIGPHNKRVMCPAKMSGGKERCYVCEKIKDLRERGEDKKSNRLKSKQRYIYQILERGDDRWAADDKEVGENPDLLGLPKIKFAGLAWTAHQQILNYHSSAEWGDIACPWNGLDIEFKRTGIGLDTSYHVTPRRFNTPAFSLPVRDPSETPQPDEKMISLIAENLYDLDDHFLYRVASFEETRAHWYGEEITPSQDGEKKKSVAPPSESHRQYPDVPF